MQERLAILATEAEGLRAALGSSEDELDRIFVLRTRDLERFAVEEREFEPILACSYCGRAVGPYGEPTTLEGGIDLEQLVRWSSEHNCAARGHRADDRPPPA